MKFGVGMLALLGSASMPSLATPASPDLRISKIIPSLFATPFPSFMLRLRITSPDGRCGDIIDALVREKRLDTLREPRDSFAIARSALSGPSTSWSVQDTTPCPIKTLPMGFRCYYRRTYLLSFAAYLCILGGICQVMLKRSRESLSEPAADGVEDAKILFLAGCTGLPGPPHYPEFCFRAF